MCDLRIRESLLTTDDATPRRETSCEMDMIPLHARKTFFRYSIEGVSDNYLKIFYSLTYGFPSFTCGPVYGHRCVFRCFYLLQLEGFDLFTVQRM